MKYKLGKIKEIYNKEGTKRIDWIKLSKGYRIAYYSKKMNAWKLNLTQDATYKKYAERRIFDIIVKYF